MEHAADFFSLKLTDFCIKKIVSALGLVALTI